MTSTDTLENDQAVSQDNIDTEKKKDVDIRFPRAYENLAISASLKTIPEDFIVDEVMDIELSGEGEHLWVRLKKRNSNTEWVARKMAEFCQVEKSAVSYAGLKDRHGVTSQWFSVHLPGKVDADTEPDWKAFESSFNLTTSDESDHVIDEQVEVLEFKRHGKKLQRGALKANRFEITLRNIESESRDADDCFSAIEQRCGDIAKHGVPNYFGEQRFGHDRLNVQRARDMLSGKNRKKGRKMPRYKRSIYLSAARSWLFNLVLSERIKNDSWKQRIEGDVFMLNGSSACFADDQSKDIDERIDNGDLHPGIVLWGEDDDMVQAEAKQLEQSIITTEPVLYDGLIAARVKAARRASRVIPQEMTCRKLDDKLIVEFVLPAGCYATVVLDEIFTMAAAVKD